MIRVLVVDDSTTVRSLLIQLLQSDPEIQVVGEASDGLEAIALTESLRPDLITMDILMPRLDGLAATKEIMFRFPTPIVLVTSSQKAKEVESSLASLGIGALDILEKPVGPLSTRFDASTLRLVSTVKAMARVKVIRHWRQPSQEAASPLQEKWKIKKPASSLPGKASIVAIAASTGGPAALQTLLSELPSDFPVPILVVQHITAGFTSGLATWLKSSCALEIRIAQQGESLAPGTVYIAPDHQHLGVTEHGNLALSSGPPIQGFRPSGTSLFHSVANVYGSSTLAVILTGMGRDGVEGLRTVHQAGGRVIAQDEATSIIFGMPAAAIEAGVVDLVLPLHGIASRIMGFV